MNPKVDFYFDKAEKWQKEVEKLRTIVLDCPVEIGLVRTRARVRGDVRGYDRFEGEQVDFHRRVRQGFMTIARAEPERVTVIDSTRELAVVSTDILIAVERLVGH